MALTGFTPHDEVGSALTIFSSPREAADATVVEFELRLPGLYNAINALAALAAGTELGVEPAGAAQALAGVEAAFGRVEQVTVDGRHLYLLLIKNPTGFNQVLQTFLTRKTGRRVLVLINDNFADGRDVSWLWDVGFEDLAGLDHDIVASGIRGADLALRLKYAGIPATVEDDVERAIAELVEGTPPGDTAYVLPTYTAMLEVRRLLGRHQEMRGIWE